MHQTITEEAVEELRPNLHHVYVDLFISTIKYYKIMLFIDNNTMSDSDSESSEEHSSSECSTDSSDDDKLEMVKLNNNQVLLPQGLCEKKDIFNEFFARSWSALGESNQKHLRQFLPKFPEGNEEQEQNITLQKLFKGENFKFSSPLDNFYEHLKDGHYRPDIAKMRSV